MSATSDKRVGPHVDFQVAGMRCKLVDHFGPTAYSTSTKEVLNPNDFEMKQIAAVFVTGPSIVDSSGAVFGDVRLRKDVAGPYAAWSVVWYSNVTGTEVVNGTDISANRVTLLVFGN